MEKKIEPQTQIGAKLKTKVDRYPARGSAPIRYPATDTGYRDRTCFTSTMMAFADEWIRWGRCVVMSDHLVHAVKGHIHVESPDPQLARDTTTRRRGFCRCEDLVEQAISGLGVKACVRLICRITIIDRQAFIRRTIEHAMEEAIQRLKVWERTSKYKHRI